MHRKIFTLTGEPKVKFYRDLLDYTAKMYPMFLLVRRPGETLDPYGVEVLGRLSGYLITEQELSSWPGTRLFGKKGKAIVSRYKLGGDSVKILTEVAVRLFEWQHPLLPEDLCILRQDGTPWLVSIAHESDAYIELFEDEKIQLIEDFPALSEFLE